MDLDGLAGVGVLVSVETGFVGVGVGLDTALVDV